MPVRFSKSILKGSSAWIPQASLGESKKSGWNTRVTENTLHFLGRMGSPTRCLCGEVAAAFQHQGGTFTPSRLGWAKGGKVHASSSKEACSAVEHLDRSAGSCGERRVCRGHGEWRHGVSGWRRDGDDRDATASGQNHDL